MKKSRIFFIGLYQSLGLVAYVAMVVLLINWLSQTFGDKTAGNNPVFGAMFLLIFVLSALITGSIALAYPIILFTRKMFKEAWWILVFTVLCIIFYVIIFLSVLLIIYH
jgi:hypothetical protein